MNEKNKKPQKQSNEVIIMDLDDWLIY